MHQRSVPPFGTLVTILSSATARRQVFFSKNDRNFIPAGGVGGGAVIKTGLPGFVDPLGGKKNMFSGTVDRIKCPHQPFVAGDLCRIGKEIKPAVMFWG